MLASAVRANQFGSERQSPPIPGWTQELSAQAAENSLGAIYDAPSPQKLTPPDFDLGSVVEDLLLGRADNRLELDDTDPLDLKLDSDVEDGVGTGF